MLRSFMVRVRKYRLYVVVGLLAVLGLLATAGYSFYQNDVALIEKTATAYFEQKLRESGEDVANRILSQPESYKFVLTRYDLQRPISTFVLSLSEAELSPNSDVIRYQTIYLQRTSFNSFEVVESTVSSSTGYTFAQAVELAQNSVVSTNTTTGNLLNLANEILVPQQLQSTQTQSQNTIQTNNQVQSTSQGGYCNSLIKDYENLIQAIKNGAKSFQGEILAISDLSTYTVAQAESQLQSTKDYCNNILNNGLSGGNLAYATCNTGLLYDRVDPKTRQGFRYEIRTRDQRVADLRDAVENGTATQSQLEAAIKDRESFYQGLCTINNPTFDLDNSSYCELIIKDYEDMIAEVERMEQEISDLEAKVADLRIKVQTGQATQAQLNAAIAELNAAKSRRNDFVFNGKVLKNYNAGRMTLGLIRDQYNSTKDSCDKPQDFLNQSN